MPLVKVHYQLEHEGHVLDTRVLEGLGASLAFAVAANLTCSDKDGDLSAEDIEVLFFPASPFNSSGYQVLVEVEATHFPDRNKNFEDRIRILGLDIRQMLPRHVSFGLWAKLNNAAWEGYPAAKVGLRQMMETTGP